MQPLNQAVRPRVISHGIVQRNAHVGKEFRPSRASELDTSVRDQFTEPGDPSPEKGAAAGDGRDILERESFDQATWNSSPPPLADNRNLPRKEGGGRQDQHGPSQFAAGPRGKHLQEI